MGLELCRGAQGSDADRHGTIPRAVHQDFPLALFVLRCPARPHRRSLWIQSVVSADDIGSEFGLFRYLSFPKLHHFLCCDLRVGALVPCWNLAFREHGKSCETLGEATSFAFFGQRRTESGM